MKQFFGFFGKDPTAKGKAGLGRERRSGGKESQNSGPKSKLEKTRLKMPLHPDFNDARISFSAGAANRLTERRDSFDYIQNDWQRATLEAEYPLYDFDDLIEQDRRDYLKRLTGRFSQESDFAALAEEERYDLLWAVGKYGPAGTAQRVLNMLLPKAPAERDVPGQIAVPDGKQWPATLRPEAVAKAKELIKGLVKVGRIRGALYLSELVDQANNSAKPLLRNETETEIALGKRWPKDTEFAKYYASEQKHMMQELPLLYSYSLALAAIENVRLLTKTGHLSLESEHLLLLARLEERIKNFVNELYPFVRSYLVIAVLSEVPYAWSVDSRGREPRVLGESQGRSATQSGIAEELVPDSETAMTMLAGARHIFIKEGAFSPSFGGKPWAQIASLAYDMYAAPETASLAEKIHLLDRASQLEHNNGTVFNKDGNRVNQGSRLSSLLDLKRNTPHLSVEILEGFLDDTHYKVPPALKTLDRDLGKLKKALRIRNAPPIPALDGVQEAA